MSKETILVIGGCGFIGYHIVKALVEGQGQFWSVHVMSRNPSSNRVEGAHYHTGSILVPEQIQETLCSVQPTVIIHAASPLPYGNGGGERQFQETNVQGTQNLINLAIASHHVRALIYTSSWTVIDAPSIVFATETIPIYTITSRADHYAKSKAIADRMVLDANGCGGLRTLCLRPAAAYGERDTQMIPGMLDILRKGQYRYQIGHNTNLFDFVSASNIALSHILAAKALLSKPDKVGPKVDGEAFFITDGRPIPFWSFAHRVWWAAAEVDLNPEEVIVVPPWFVLTMATVIEWIYWAFTLGLRTPKVWTRQSMSYTCQPRTCSIAKARSVLRYVPLDDRDEQIRKGVEWELRSQDTAR
ncbi:MAG: hypothetical protein Q9202_006847 [Teloschistes flavicans]